MESWIKIKREAAFPMTLAPFISLMTLQSFCWQRTKALEVTFSFTISQIHLYWDIFVEVHCVPRAED